MRVLDATDAVYFELRALDPRRYLCAMWIVCVGLRAIYADRLTGDEGALMTSTLDTVRDVLIQGDTAPETAGYAAGLHARWAAMAAEDTVKVMPGHWNTWAVFRDLAGEVAGACGRYEAAGRVDLAATDRWREGRPGLLREDDPDEEAGDLTPMGRSLAFLRRAVGGVAGLPEAGTAGAGWDPEVVAEVIGALGGGSTPASPGERFPFLDASPKARDREPGKSAAESCWDILLAEDEYRDEREMLSLLHSRPRIRALRPEFYLRTLRLFEDPGDRRGHRVNVELDDSGSWTVWSSRDEERAHVSGDAYGMYRYLPRAGKGLAGLEIRDLPNAVESLI